MAEKIQIAQFTFESDELVSNLESVSKQIANLKEEQKGLKKGGQESSEAFIKNAAQLKTLGKEYRDGVTAVGALDKANKILAAGTDNNGKSIRQVRTETQALIKARNELKDVEGANSENVKKLNKQIDSNTEFIKDNVSGYEKIKLNIGNYTESIKAAFGATGGFSKELAIVQSGFSALAPVFKASVEDFKNIIGGFKEAQAGASGLSKAQRVGATATNAASASLKIFRLALISTGIGAVVVALGSLVSFLATTQKGIDAVTSVTRPLQAIFKSLIGVFQNVGESLFNAFSNPKQVLTDLVDFVKGQLINRFTAFSKILEGIATLDFDKLKDGALQAATGVENFEQKITDAAAKTSAFLSDAADKGTQIDQLTKQIEQSENALILTRATSLKQIKDAELIAKDQTKSVAERNEATQTAIKLSEELAVAEQDILDKKIEVKEIENSLNDTTRADIAELNKLKADRVKKDEEADARRLRFLGTQTQLARENEAKAKAAADARLTALKEETDLNLKKLEIEAKTSEERLNFEKVQFDEKKKLLQEELANEKITREQFNNQLFDLEQEKVNNINEIVKEQNENIRNEALLQLDIEAEKNRTILESTKDFFNERIALAENEKDVLLQIEKDRLSQGLINQTEFELSKLQIETDFLAQRDEINKQRDEAAEEKRQLDLERENEERALAIEKQLENNAADLEIQLAQLELEKDIALQNADLTESEKLRIKRQFANKESELRQKALDAEFQTTTSVLNAIGQFANENSIAAKGVAAALATVNTFQAITKALATSTDVNPVTRVANAIAVGAAGFVQVRKILSTPIPRAEKGMFVENGGVLQGKRHSQGGVMIEAEGGEYIINRKSTAKYRTVLDKINADTGGIKGINKTGFFQQGGQVANISNISNLQINSKLSVDINEDSISKIGASVGAANEQLPTPVVSTSQIEQDILQRNEINQIATL